MVAKMVGASEDLIRSVREGDEIQDVKLRALRRFTRRVVATSGWVSDEDVKLFIDAGYTKAQLLEVLVGVTQKTLSNYTNHIAHTPLDAAFAASACVPGEKRGVDV
jgi:alkylhydroperoxidase family enzyme